MTLLLIIIWSVLSSFFLVKLFLRITLLDKLVEKKMIIAIVVNSAIALIFSTLSLSYIQYPLFIMCLFCLFYQERLSDCNISQIVFSAIFSVLLVVLCNYLQQRSLELIWNVTLKNNNFEILTYIVLEIIDILIVYIIPQQFFLYIFNMFQQSEFFKISLSTVSLIFFYTLGIIEDVKKSQITELLYGNHNISILIVFIGMLLAFISMFTGFHIHQTKQKTEMYKELEKYSREVTKINEEMAMFRHDYMNILYSLRMAINDKDIESVEAIYNDTISPTVKFINRQNYEIAKLDKICIPEIKSMLFVKINIAKNQNIDVSFKANGILEKFSVSKIVFLRIFSIFFDNAIAGASNSVDKEIDITFEEKPDVWIFKIANTIQEKIDANKIFVKGYTTKWTNPDRNSGLGLYYVRKIIEKDNQLDLETEIDKHYFTQILYMRKAS